MLTTQRKTIRKVASIFTPPPQITLSEWADENRQLSSEASAEPGQWKTSKVPYARAVMDACTDKLTRRVVCKFAAQVAKTEIILNLVGYHADLDPCPILLVYPNLEFAEAFSVERLAPMIRDTPVLRNKFSDPRSRNGSNKKRHKTFRGGFAAIVASESPAGLAGRPIRILAMDEPDRYPMSAGTEGDPVAIVSKRVSTFWNHKIIMTATPTIEGMSRIDTAYQYSTQEQWFVPCPRCGHPQVPSFWRMDFKTLLHGCERCEKRSDQPDWLAASQEGEWRAQKTHDVDGRILRTRGFHLAAMVSPWVLWSDLALEFREGKGQFDQGDPTTLMVFYNTRLAECWEDKGDKVDEEGLLKRRQVYPSELPDEVLFLTAGVDVQDNRLCYEILGWGLDRECWGIEYGTIWGDPRGAEVWEKLDERVYNRDWSYLDGAKLKAGRIFVDSGGHATQDVYRYTKSRSPRVFAIKGQGGLGLPVIKHTSFNNRDRAPLIILGVDTVKEEILTRLRVEQYGPGYCHYPRLADGNDSRGYDIEYFKGLTSERRAVKFLKGFKKFEWIKKNTQGNEPFDCRVYASAALEHAGGGDMLSRAERPRVGPSEDKPIKFGTVDQEQFEKEKVLNQVAKVENKSGWVPKWKKR